MSKIENPHLARAYELFKNDKAGRAKRIASKVLANNPDLPEALDLLASIEMQRGNFTAAIPLLEKACQGKKKDPEIFNRLGFCHRVSRQNEKALEAFKAALEIDPKNFRALFGAGGILITLGKIEEAQKYLEKAIEGQPPNLEPFRLLATLTPLAKDKKFLDKMLKILPRVEDYTRDDQAHLHFAIASAYAARGQNEKFAEFTEKANRFLKGEDNEWFAANKLAYDLSARTFTPELVKTKTPKGAKKFTPVFIVGLPRSGSTLLEQVLASHSKIYGADEMPFIRRLFVEDMTRHYGTIYPKFLTDMPEEERIELAKTYQDRVLEINPESPFIIDKMVGNAFFIGMIRMVLPWAKVIHVKRHPGDTALSMYSSYFASTVPYANDLAELVKYFRLHVDYMKLWDRVCPDFVCHVKYEDLVQNLEKEARRIVKFCGLDWEKACLEFHKTERSVMTLSAGQVRSKVYTSSVGKWKNHREMLNPFLKGVEDLLEEYGY